MDAQRGSTRSLLFDSPKRKLDGLREQWAPPAARNMEATAKAPLGGTNGNDPIRRGLYFRTCDGALDCISVNIL